MTARGSQNAPSGRHGAATRLPISPLSEFVLRHEARPWTLNGERSGHWRKHRALTDKWRGVFHLLALEADIPHLTAIEVLVDHELKDRRWTPDTGACIGAVKAAIDGLVDAGVLDDDGPDYVHQLTFRRPTVTGVDAVTLTLWSAA